MFNKMKEKLASEAVQKSIGVIADLAKTHVGPKLKEISEDEQKFKDALGKVYSALPNLVSAVCSKETFVNLCWEHKDKIVKPEAAANS